MYMHDIYIYIYISNNLSLSIYIYMYVSYYHVSWGKDAGAVSSLPEEHPPAGLMVLLRIIIITTIFSTITITNTMITINITT